MLMNIEEYFESIESIKNEIKSAQYKATVSVNRELIMLYYNCLSYTSDAADEL